MGYQNDDVFITQPKINYQDYSIKNHQVGAKGIEPAAGHLKVAKGDPRCYLSVQAFK